MKIHEAARSVLLEARCELHLSEIVGLIQEKDLYEFKAMDPKSALDTQLARRSLFVSITNHSGENVFYRASPGTYGLLELLSENPGKGVYDILKMIYNKNKEPSNSLASIADKTLGADGALISSSRDSLFYYMTRRLISFSVYKRRFYKKNGISDRNLFRADLRKYLFNRTAIPEKYYGLLTELMIESALAGLKKIPKGLRNRMLERAKNNDVKCYLCGCDLDFVNLGRPNSFELEHVWPRSLGGSSSEINLKPACNRCNRDKSSLVCSADTHFESLCLVTDEKEPSFLRELTNCNRITLIAKNKGCCSVCGQPAETVGKLYVGRENKDDNLHFFNSVNVCSAHGV